MNVNSTGTDKASYRFHHSMIRVKDPEKSLNFYRSVMGMSLLKTFEHADAKFNLYFLGYRHSSENEIPEEKLLSREGILGI